MNKNRKIVSLSPSANLNWVALGMAVFQRNTVMDYA